MTKVFHLFCIKIVDNWNLLNIIGSQHFTQVNLRNIGAEFIRFYLLNKFIASDTYNMCTMRWPLKKRFVKKKVSVQKVSSWNFRGSPYENFCAGMSPLEMIDEKDSLGRKMPKNDAIVKCLTILVHLCWKKISHRGMVKCIVISSKVCKDFPRESSNTFAPKVEGAKVFADFGGNNARISLWKSILIGLSKRKSAKTLEVITRDFQYEILYSYYLQSLCRLWK